MRDRRLLTPRNFQNSFKQQMFNNYSIILTVDVEDWFHVENFKRCIPYSSWPRYELRVEKNTYSILDLLDSIELNKPTSSGEASNSTNSINPTNPNSSGNSLHPKKSPKATFFILGWVAERLPHLVREIQARGHEVASHGYSHRLCRGEPVSALKRDLMVSKKLLEEIAGGPIYGYRAPNFSIDDDMLKLIEDCGYLYDSSFNSFGMNKRYGQIALASNGKNGIAFQVSHIFYELPISNLKLGKQVLPWGGGGYFRLIPSPLFNLGVKSILKKEKGYLFYFHPWEIDPEQPRLREASKFFKFRHYVNLYKTVSKLSSFIESFKEYNFVTCHKYLEMENPITQIAQKTI